MAGAGVELATAWVRLVPSMEGVTDNVVKAFSPTSAIAAAEGAKSGKKWSTGMKTAVVGGAALVGAGVVAGFKGLYSVGATFQEVTDTIRTGTGAQGKALKGLTDVAKQVGTSVPADFSKIGPVVADLNTRLGLSGGTLKTVASQYLEAGRILKQDVDIKTTTAAFTAFGIKGKDVEAGMDDLFRVSQATGVGMNDLASSVQRGAPALKNLGFGFRDSIALMGSLDKAGLNSNQMMSSMSKGLVTLSKNGEKPAAAFQRVTKEIQGYVDKGDTAAALNLASKVFGTKGATQFVGALQSGTLKMGDLMKATGATSDTILGVGKDATAFGERWKMTMNSAMVAIEPLAKGVFDGLDKTLQAVMPTLQKLGGWVSKHTQVIPILAGAIGVTLVAALISFAAGVWTTTVALLASPITWIVIGIVALIAAVVALVMNWDKVVKFIVDVWGGFVGWLRGIVDGLVNWWGGVWSGFSDWVTGIWQGIVDWITGVWSGFTGWIQGVVDGFVGFVKSHWGLLLSFFIGPIGLVIQWVTQNWSAILAWLRGAIDAFKGWWQSTWAAVGSFFTGLWNGMLSGVRGVVNGISSVVHSVVGGIAGWWRSMWSSLSSIFTSVWNAISGTIRRVGGVFSSVFAGIRGSVVSAFNGVVSIVRGAVNGVIGLVNGAIRGLNRLHVSIPSWVPVIGGQSFGVNLPTIPRLAAGGTVLPRNGGTLAVLAEAGRPESVVDTGLLNRALEEGLAGKAQQVVVQGPLVQVEEMRVDSDRRVDEVAQDLYERGQQAARAAGKINLQGAVA